MNGHENIDEFKEIKLNPGYIYVMHSPLYGENLYNIEIIDTLHSSECIFKSLLLPDMKIAKDMLVEKLANFRIRPHYRFFRCPLDKIKMHINEINIYFFGSPSNEVCL